jgi:alpha-N-acetylglucosaminidase
MKRRLFFPASAFASVWLLGFATFHLCSHGMASEPLQTGPDIALVPQPVELRAGPGFFRITPETKVVASGPAVPTAKQLIDTLAPAMGFRLRLSENEASESAGIALSLNESLRIKLGSEGYRLEVAPKRISLRASEAAGLFYAVQTLRQLLPTQVFSTQPAGPVEWTVPAVSITDAPRFGWRGLLIDPARHFIPVQDVKWFIDVMAMHKFNRLQMHLTDNEGWRIEIKKYPKLTELGSQMDWNASHASGTGPRGFGFYTQDDIRALVQYAAERHVIIVPEIEMPYHAGSAIVAYPEHGVNTAPLADQPVENRWGRSRGLLGARPATVSFMQDILAEVIELFPSPFIHVGGDEANLQWWTEDPEMQTIMKQLGLRDAHQLHSWFLRQMDAFLTAKGRRMIGWDEILQGGLAPGATVMSWRGVRGGIAAAQAGHDVIMAPTSHTYFDYYQGPRDKEPPAIGGMLPVDKVYEFEPIPPNLKADEAKHILGGQGQLWGEFIATPEHREYMTWPRACALIETLWSPAANRNLDLFLVRLDRHLERLAAAGVNFRPLDRKPARWPGKSDKEAPNAAQDLLRRLLPHQTDQFAFEVIAPVYGRDVFELETVHNKLVIRGNTGVAMARGLNWYLKYYCDCQVSWQGNQLHLPDPLPMVQSKVRQVTWARHRYFLNYCCFGYSLPWWDWKQWERLIDWMALNGVNLPLSVTGQEAVWQAVCRRLGLSEAQISAFLAGPPYLPFGWMGCLDGWGGPLPQSWIDRHEDLEKKILARERSLGMTPVLQGFTGHVPPGVAEKYPDAKWHQIHWIEWNTKLLDPLDPLFAKIAGLFLEEQTRLFGTDHYYAADTFIEMTPPSGDLEYLDRLGRAIYDGMARSDSHAVWVLQGWTFMNQAQFWTPPRFKAFLDAAPNERMVVLDLFCESKPMWSRTDAFCGKPWLWCNVQNFGGTVCLGGALERNNTALQAARRDPQAGTLIGLGFVNEGLGYNPPVYDLMYEMAWRDQPVDLDQWIKGYARHRYGKANRDAALAWQTLLDTVYTSPPGTRSMIDHLPTLKAGGGSPYNNAQLAKAWQRLLEAAGDAGNVDAYRFDLVNVARQVLSNHASRLHQRIAAAYASGDATAFRSAADAFLQLIRDLDGLLRTRQEFLLGPWLENAKRWGATDAERARFEWNARRVLTLWGATPAIDDYARKEWSGMLNGYYLERWDKFLSAAGKALEDKVPFDEERSVRELRRWTARWADQQETYPAQPTGDSVRIARRLWTKYSESFKPDALSLTTGKPASCSTALPRHPARLANDGFADNTDRFWAMDITSGQPAWWQVDFEQPTTVGRVVVVGFYGDQRHYGFTVETSLDGQRWDLVADRRNNEAPSTRQGYTCQFPPRPARYLRVTQTHNSANTGRHLVEVMAFEK